jgi:NAD(P)-dependent dehydrogenase (short-subunit alcohol dehydrogenase family)
MAPPASSFFHNRVIAVSGGGSGIGFQTVKQLLALGARVSVADWRLSENLATELGSKGDNLMTVQVDVTNAKQVEDWIKNTVEKWGRLDGAANLAGTVPKDHNYGSILTTPDDDWARTLAVNIDGTKNCLREQAKYIGKGYLEEFKGEQISVGEGNPKAEGGSIVNTGSTLSLYGTAGTAAYTASKHAVLGLTRSAAKEFGPQGVRVNCLCP